MHTGGKKSEAKPDQCRKRMAVGKNRSKNDSSKITEHELNGIRVQACNTGWGLESVVELVNHLVKDTPMDESVRPVEPYVDHYKVNDQLRDFNVEHPWIVLMHELSTM